MNKDRFVVRRVVPGKKQVKHQSRDDQAEGENSPDYCIYAQPFHPYTGKGVAFLVGMGNMQRGGHAVQKLWDDDHYRYGNGEGV